MADHPIANAQPAEPMAVQPDVTLDLATALFKALLARLGRDFAGDVRMQLQYRFDTMRAKGGLAAAEAEASRCQFVDAWELLTGEPW